MLVGHADGPHRPDAQRRGPRRTPGPARVRVCQLGECNDPDYRLVTGVFTITPASAVRPREAAGSARLSVHPAEGNLNVSFSLEREEEAVLEALDIRGTRVAVLLAHSQS